MSFFKKRPPLPSARLTQEEVEKIASAFLKSDGLTDTGWTGARFQWDEKDSTRAVWRLTQISNDPPSVRTTPSHIWIDDESGRVIRIGARDGSPVAG